MDKLTIQKIPFSKDADSMMRSLKAKTGITPNLLCRAGFCMSLEKGRLTSRDYFEGTAAREINRFTLTGGYDSLMTTLLLVWREEYGSVVDSLESLFVAHMNRGVQMVWNNRNML